MERKSVLLSGFLLISLLGGAGSAFADKVDFTASTHINRGTCAISSGTSGLTFDFGNVTPLEAFAATKVIEKNFSLANCVAVNSLKLSLTSTTTTNLASGAYQGTWIIPAAGGAKGVAYKTEVKNGATGMYHPLYADNKEANTGSDVFVPTYSLYIKSTLIPTVVSTSAMVSGALTSAAVLNITYQ